MWKRGHSYTVGDKTDNFWRTTRQNLVNLNIAIQILNTNVKATPMHDTRMP